MNLFPWATVSLQRLILNFTCCFADLVVEQGASRQKMPLAQFKRCAVEQTGASILDIFRSDPETYIAALMKVHRDIW